MSNGDGLPKGWAVARLGCIGTWHGGGTPSKFNDAYWSSGTIPWISPKDMKSPRLSDSEDHISSAALKETNVKAVPPGTVLVVIRSGILSRTLPIAVADVQATMNQDLKGVFPHDGIDPTYLAYFLRSNEHDILRRCSKHGTTVASIDTNALHSYPCRIAPPPEQRRIVAKIEELFSDLDAGMAALERAKAKLKRYRAAVLKAAVEGKLTEEWRKRNIRRTDIPVRHKDPEDKHSCQSTHQDGSSCMSKRGRQECLPSCAESLGTIETASQLLEGILKERRRKWEEAQLAAYAKADKKPPANWKEKYREPASPDTTDLPALPEGWCWAKLDQLLVYLRNGYFQSPSGAEAGTPILRINAVRPMNVDFSEVRFLDTIDGNVDDYFIHDGDLLFTRYNGSVDLLGVAGMVRGCTDKMLHPDKLIRVKLAIDDPLPSFIEIAANVGTSRKHMVGRARTTAGQTGISGTDVREMPIPLPPLDEQSQIVAEVAERLSHIGAGQTAIDHSLLRASRLRQSILKRAFEGKLAPQDPNDEPASVLMERLAEGRSFHKTGKEGKMVRRLPGRPAKRV